MLPTTPSKEVPESAHGHQLWLMRRLAEKALGNGGDEKPGSSVVVLPPNSEGNPVHLTTTKHPEYGTFVHVGDGTPLSSHLVAHRPDPHHEGPKEIAPSPSVPAATAQTLIDYFVQPK